ncbi:unnamed protein product [Heligmosomoides polygyrus]|uniref:Uncharacterized protein n=1 Tax=Heligmosomoides polygyrus TaxID=6339 RepID=A0A183GX60_HELPZ|nr:unnamed protein product [Heligmosomoides polygyrus]
MFVSRVGQPNLVSSSMTEGVECTARLKVELIAFATPWERSGELFCARHRVERNSCCATVTASRATFIILYAVEQLLK